MRERERDSGKVREGYSVYSVQYSEIEREMEREREIEMERE